VIEIEEWEPKSDENDQVDPASGDGGSFGGGGATESSLLAGSLSLVDWRRAGNYSIIHYGGRRLYHWSDRSDFGKARIETNVQIGSTTS